MSAAADGAYSFRAQVSAAAGPGRGEDAAGPRRMRSSFPGDNVAPASPLAPRGSRQAFLETLLKKGILVLCNIFRGFSLHVQLKVTQS